MTSISMAASQLDTFHAAHAEVSQPPQGAAPFAAGPGVVVVLFLVAALVVGAIARAVAVLWAMMRSMLALVGTLAVVLTAVIVLADATLSSSVGPKPTSPSPAVPSQPAVAPTHDLPPLQGNATTGYRTAHPRGH